MSRWVDEVMSLGVKETAAFPSIEVYQSLSTRVRRTVLDMIYRTRSPHIGPSYSIVEALVALYFKVMNIAPDTAAHPERDRFILSKGHACAALYAVLRECGFMSDEDLKGFAINGGLLEQHPRFDLSQGIELSTGSLGHGLSVGAGMALAGKLDRKKYHVYVLLGDGELNEGSVWEAVMFAGHHKLSNLTALIDHNKMQALGNAQEILDLRPLGEKWKSFGWEVKEVDGHSFNQLFDALERPSHARPNALILHTTKGKGVSFMENSLLWHYRAPDAEEYARAQEELSL